MPKMTFSALKPPLFLLLSLLLSFSATSGDANLEYAVKSAVALNFARFTEWPASTNATVNFCLLAEPSVQQAFMVIDKKNVGNKNLAVIKLTAINDLEGCQLLYVSESYSSQIKQIRNETVSRHILIIGHCFHSLHQI